MPANNAKRTISTKLVTPAQLAKPTARAISVAASKPVNTAPLGTAAAAQAPRSNVAKPAVTTVPTTNQADNAAQAPRGLTRDAAGIVRNATNYDTYSDRDTAYLRFFGSVMRQHNGSATLRQIHDAGIARADAPSRKRFNPHYSGSGKATDIGAVNRIRKAGYITVSADGNTLTVTPSGLAHAAYRGTAA